MPGADRGRSKPAHPHSRFGKALSQSIIDDKSGLYRRRFLSASFLVGLLLPASIGVISWRTGEHWNFAPLLAASAVLLAGFAASRLLSRRGLEILITLFLFAYPLAYAWGAFAPGNHQTYVVVLLCIPPIFDSVAQRRWYWHWFAYALSAVVAILFSYLIGLPSRWITDFSPGVIAVLHIAFLSLWILRYVTRHQIGKYIEEIADSIVRDKATGLPTNVAFRKAFEKGKTTFVGLIAIGNFHELSALFGYSISTGVLSIAASRLREAESVLSGCAFSLRGHDFGFVRPLAEGESAQDIAEKLRDSLRGPMDFHGKTIELSYRIGFTITDDGNAERSLDEAEDALDMAEKGGLDTASYSGSWGKVGEAEIAIADLMTLSRNVTENKLAVFYQPVISLTSGKVAWNESLVRFQGKGERYEEPSRFMSLASTTGHWAAIEDFMFEKAAERACGGGGPVSLNIALRDLDRKEFREALETKARVALEKRSALILEILEGNFDALSEGRLRALKEVREAGCLIAIDDFGTGYSNYSRLLTMPVDIVKFDRSMVLSARASKAEATLVQGLVRYCYDIGALTVAEGIETMDLVEFAQTLGFDFGQGYYWSRPVPETEALAAERTPLLAGKLVRH
jgi:EAL domain-containing protein (putative c-di-GMP-specific phosphodiesterase class I)/GGDEF domain-containing protein